MKLSYKIAASFILLACQFIVAYLIFLSFLVKNANPRLFFSLLDAIPLLYVPLIIMGWVWVDEVFGFSLMVFSIVLAFAAFAFSGGSMLMLHFAVCACSGYVGHLFSKRMNSIFETNRAELEKLDRESNTLRAERERQKSLYDAMQKKYERYRALKDVTQTLGSHLSLDEVVHYTVDRAYALINKCDAAMLYLLDQETQTLALKSSRLAAPSVKIRSKLGDIFDNWVLKKLTPLIVDDAKKDFRFDLGGVAPDEHPYASLIIAPLIAEKRVLGILRLDSQRPLAFTPDDLRLLDILSDLSAVAIKNCMLYLKTQELAIKDSLTGLFVHRHFKERLREELIRSGRANVPVSLILLDIDHFKDYNDRFGHTAGDIVLKSIAQILKDKTGPGELAARYGGEEFVLILPGAGRDQALALAEEIRTKVESASVTLRREQTRVTVSLGVATFPTDSLVEDEILKIADARLYKAKQAGRNRVCDG